MTTYIAIVVLVGMWITAAVYEPYSTMSALLMLTTVALMYVLRDKLKRLWCQIAHSDLDRNGWSDDVSKRYWFVCRKCGCEFEGRSR